MGNANFSDEASTQYISVLNTFEVTTKDTIHFSKLQLNVNIMVQPPCFSLVGKKSITA
jgi:hypothetical protein